MNLENNLFLITKPRKQRRTKAKAGDMRLERGKIVSELMKQGYTLSEASKEASTMRQKYGKYLT
jgi:hypothetical protein